MKKSKKGPHSVWTHLYKLLRIYKTIEIESRFLVQRMREWGKMARGQEKGISAGGEENILKL